MVAWSTSSIRRHGERLSEENGSEAKKAESRVHRQERRDTDATGTRDLSQMCIVVQVHFVNTPNGADGLIAQRQICPIAYSEPHCNCRWEETVIGNNFVFFANKCDGDGREKNRKSSFQN